MTNESKYYILMHGLYLGFANVFIFDGPLFILLTGPDEIAKPLTTTVMFAGAISVFFIPLLFNMKNDAFKVLLPVSVASTLVMFFLYIIFGYFAKSTSFIIIPVLNFLISASAMLYMINTIACLVRIIPLNKIHISIVLITLLTYLVVYITDLLTANGLEQSALMVALLVLIIALAFSLRLKSVEYENIVYYQIKPDYKTIGVLTIATFLLNLSTCGIAIPAIKNMMLNHSERIVYFYMLPLLLVAILLIRRSSSLQNSMDIALILSAAAYALGFVLFIYSQKNIFLTNALLQSAYPVVDVILWSLAIQMIHIYGKSYRIAALMTFAVVFSAYLGITGGELLIGRTDEPHVTLSFVSLIGAILAIMVIPFLTRMVKEHIRALYANYSNYQLKTKTRERLQLLTSRELEIVGFLAEDIRNREIADKLSISENTIKTHARNIYSKLDVKNKRELRMLLNYEQNESADTNFHK